LSRALGALIAVVVGCCLPTPVQAAGSADVSISVTGPSMVDQSTNAQFTVAYANAGPDGATNLTVALHVPTGLFIDLIDSSGFCTVAVGGQDVSCNVGSVAAGASGSLPIVITANTVGTYSIPFSVTSDQTDPNPSNNAVTETLQVVPPTHADLFMGFVNTNTTVRATETAVIQASYGNDGPLDATGVVITFQLGAGLHYQVASSDPRCSSAAQTITCAIGPVAVGSLALLFIDVSADTAGSYPVAGSIQGNQPDQNPANNSASFNLQFLPAVAGVGLQFTGTLIRPLVGHPVQLDLQVFNTGPDAGTGVVVQVTFPQGWTVDPTSSDPRCAGTSGGLICHVGSLLAQTSTLMTVVGTPSTAGTFTVSATVTADQFPAGTFNQTSTQVNVFTPSADLSVTVSGPFQPVAKKAPIVYTLVFRNGGPDIAAGVTLTDSWSETGIQNIEFQAASTTYGTCSHKGNALTCKLGDVPADTTATVTIQLAAFGSGTMVDNAVATSSTPDPNPANNSASVSTVVT
jgi:hypothetical protein